MPAGSTIDAAKAVQYVDIGHTGRIQVRSAGRVLRPAGGGPWQVFDSPPSASSGAGRREPEPETGPASAGQRTQARGSRVVEMESLSAASDGTSQAGDRAAHLERVRISTYSDQEVLREKDFKKLTAEETAQAVRLLKELRWRPAPRKTKRWVSGERVLHRTDTGCWRDSHVARPIRTRPRRGQERRHRGVLCCFATSAVRWSATRGCCCGSPAA